jgi:hypothetical protein
VISSNEYTIMKQPNIKQPDRPGLVLLHAEQPDRDGLATTLNLWVFFAGNHLISSSVNPN